MYLFEIFWICLLFTFGAYIFSVSIALLAGWLFAHLIAHSTQLVSSLLSHSVLFCVCFYSVLENVPFVYFGSKSFFGCIYIVRNSANAFSAPKNWMPFRRSSTASPFIAIVHTLSNICNQMAATAYATYNSNNNIQI